MASAVHYLAHAMHRDENGTRKMTMSRNKRYAKQYVNARLRRRRKAHERLQRDQAPAQRAIEALEQALHDLSLPDTLVAEIEDRRRRQQKLLGKIVGCLFPSLCGCRTPAALARVRGWDKNLPAQILGALPKRSWLKRLRRLGLEGLGPRWRHVQDKSPATHSRWPWTWVADDSVVHTCGQPLGRVGLWWSGQEKRVRPGIDGVLLGVVIGDGTLVVPVAFAIRRPDPKGPGGHCRDKLCGVQTMLDERLAALERRGLNLPSPVVVADSWLSDSKLMTPVRFEHQGTLLVEGTRSYAVALPDGRQVKGRDLLDQAAWAWREHPWEPRVRSARLTATRPTDGVVTIVIVDEPGQDRVYLMCLATSVIAPQLIRRWRRRSWIESCFRTLQHLLATEACQVHREGAD